MKNLQNKFISGLDGLRALAVIMVVGYHLSFSLFKGGVLGGYHFLCYFWIFNY